MSIKEKDDLSKSLIGFRKRNHLTQAQVAEKIGIPRERYAKYENGTPLSFDTAVKLADIYNIRLDSLRGIPTLSVARDDALHEAAPSPTQVEDFFKMDVDPDGDTPANVVKMLKIFKEVLTPKEKRLLFFKITEMISGQ